MAVTDKVGTLVGDLLAPLVGAASALRRTRLFHPHGYVYAGAVQAVATEPPFAALASRLAGDALVRLSNAWWRARPERRDVLGIAVRLRATPEVSAEPAPGDQDLLFATIRRPWTTALAPLSTDPRDFLSNHYYAVSPFELEGVGRARLRLVPMKPSPEDAGLDRHARLQRAVSAGAADLRLEVKLLGQPGSWAPLAIIHLREPIVLDQEALEFSPFRDGRGVRPRGFVHAMRHGTYWASRRARGLVSRGRVASW